MDAEAGDDVFLPPAAECTAPPLAPGGDRPSTQTPDRDPCVSRAGEGTGEVTQAKGNPPGLGWHPAERQTLADQNEVADEVAGNRREENQHPQEKEEPEVMETQTPCEKADASSSQRPENVNSTPMGSDASEKSHSLDMLDSRSDVSEEGSGSLSGHTGDTFSTKTNLDEEYTASPTPDNANDEEVEMSGALLQSEQTKQIKNKQTESPGECSAAYCVPAGTTADSHVTIACHDCLASNVTDLNDDESAEEESCFRTAVRGDIMELPDLVVADVDPNVEKCAGLLPPDCSLAMEQQTRRQSDDLPSLPSRLTVESCGDQLTELLLPSPAPEGLKAVGDGSGAISYVIQQGELLLQRLQWVQDRQDMQQQPTAKPADVSGNQTACEEEQVEGGSPRNEGDSVGVEEEEGGAYEAELREEQGSILVEERQEDGLTEGKVTRERSVEGHDEGPLVVMPRDPVAGLRPRHRNPRLKDVLIDDQSDSGVSADFSPSLPQELPVTTQTPGGVDIRETNRTLPMTTDDHDDVLEIPFKTPILLKPQQGEDTSLAKTSDVAWQFSERKMQNEITQERRREQVLVNQGTIPGEYRKEGTRLLKETKRLFEGLHQSSADGALKFSKTHFPDPVYPSVLERTFSMEMLSLRTQPVCRSQSLRVPRSEDTKRGGRWERCRSRSPVAGQTPYTRQDRQCRRYRSMDSLRGEAPAPTQEGQTKAAKSLEPFLGENPFFKLRPSLARQPEVQRDIQESRQREEELRKQRCSLYGEKSSQSQEEEEEGEEQDSTVAVESAADARQQSKGKLDRIWPPPPRTSQQSSGQTQGSCSPRPVGHVTGLSQLWETGGHLGPNPDRA